MGTEHDDKFCCGTCELADRTARGEVVFETSPELIVGVSDTCLMVTVSTTVRRFELSRGVHWIVGRDPTCDIVIDSAMASRRIFSLDVLADGAVVIEDVGSACGTLVNGVRVAKARLRRKDQIAVGGGLLIPQQGEAQPRVPPALPTARAQPRGWWSRWLGRARGAWSAHGDVAGDAIRRRDG